MEPTVRFVKAALQTFHLYRSMRSSPWKFVERTGKIFVMLWPMRIAGDVPVQIALKELLCGPLLLAEATSAHKICRRLQMAPHANQTFGNIWIALNGAVSLRVGNDHRISQPLKLIDRSLVILEITLGCMGVKLEQKLIAAIETEIRCPFLHTEFNQLGMSDLEAHLQGKAVRMCLELIKCTPHDLEVEIRIPAVRRADDAGDSCGFCRVEHLEAGVEVPSPIIDPGKNMAMNVSQH